MYFCNRNKRYFVTWPKGAAPQLENVLMMGSKKGFHPREVQKPSASTYYYGTNTMLSSVSRSRLDCELRLSPGPGRTHSPTPAPELHETDSGGGGGADQPRKIKWSSDSSMGKGGPLRERRGGWERDCGLLKGEKSWGRLQRVGSASAARLADEALAVPCPWLRPNTRSAGVVVRPSSRSFLWIAKRS